jgi:hypothetical protein
MVKKFGDFIIGDIKEGEREYFERELNARKKGRIQRSESNDVGFTDLKDFITTEIQNKEDYHITIGKRQTGVDDVKDDEIHIEYDSPEMGRVRVFKPKDDSDRGYYEVNGKVHHTDADDIRNFYHFLTQQIKQKPIIENNKNIYSYMKRFDDYIEDYKLNENLDKAKKLLSELNIPQTDPRFVKLRELLKNNLGYMGQFTKWYIKDHEEWGKIEDTFKELKNVRIDKPIESFEKLEQLYDYIQQFEINKKVNQIINTLPSHTRENASPELVELLKLNIEWEDAIKSFYRNKGGRYNKNSNWWKLPSEFKSYKEWLVDVTKTLIKNLKGGFNLESIKEKMEKGGLKVKPLDSDVPGTYDVEIIIETPDLLMVRVNNFKASAKIGSSHWCISQSQSYWNSYVTEFTQQYFIYDFTKDISDIKHMIGATISPSNKITAAHFANDRSVGDMSYFDNL